MGSLLKYAVVAALTAAIFATSAPALAHDRDSMEIDPVCIGSTPSVAIALMPADAEWLNDYLTLGETIYALERGLTQEILRCYREREAMERTGTVVHFSVPRFVRSASSGVEQWRPLVEAYFPAEWVGWALHIMECESGGDPYASNPYSSASGLFQHLERYWDERAAKAGWPGASVWDPEANIAVSAWLLQNGGTGQWACKAQK